MHRSIAGRNIYLQNWLFPMKVQDLLLESETFFLHISVAKKHQVKAFLKSNLWHFLRLGKSLGSCPYTLNVPLSLFDMQLTKSLAFSPGNLSFAKITSKCFLTSHCRCWRNQASNPLPSPTKSNKNSHVWTKNKHRIYPSPKTKATTNMMVWKMKFSFWGL